MIKRLSTKVHDTDVNINFPDKSVIFLKSEYADYYLHIIEALVGTDFTGRLRDMDIKYGFRYDLEEDDTSSLVFENGVIEGSNKVVIQMGSLPSIHCIRTLSGTIYRSFIFSDKLTNQDISIDMRKYTSMIPDSSWFRIIKLTNNLLGFDYVSLSDRVLSFNPSFEHELSEDAMQFIYLIICECFLTPSGYYRLFLCSDIDCLSKDWQVKLFNVLSTVNRGITIVSACKVLPVDIMDYPSMTIINV